MAVKQGKPERRRRKKESNDDDGLLDSNGTNGKIVTSESILDEAKGLDFSKEDLGDVKQFYIKYRDSFQQKTPRTFLHVLAERSAPGAETVEDWPKERLCSFMKWFLQHYNHFLEIRTESGVDSKDYPLHTAFSKRNYVFVEAVLSHPSIKNLQQVLEQKTTRNQTYIHLAISSKSPVVKLVAEKCKELRINNIWKGSGEKRLTPLHVAVQQVHKFCSILETNLSSGSNDSEQADSTSILSRVKSLLKTGQESVPAADGNIINIVNIFEDWKKAVLGSSGESRISAVKPKAVADLLLELICDHQKSEDRMSQVEVVELLISFCDTVLSEKGLVDFVTDNEAGETPEEPPEELTPYQMRLSELKDAWEDLVEFLQDEGIHVSEKDRDGALRQVVIKDPVADAIRSHCLHNFDRDRIAKCLYQPGEERDIDFDLSGLPSPTISNAFLKSLSNHLKFESILKYVALPKLALDDPEEIDGENGEKTISPAKKKTVADLRAVFNWLRRNGVKSIITVRVIDYGHPCHSDEAIEEALEGFQVENWDWKKVDLCTDVIAASSNQVKSISLYSSGNNAVLMGWASSEGLLNSKKFSQLQKVRLFIQQGQESTKRRSQNIKAFEEKVGSIKIRTDGKEKPVTVEHRLDDGNVSYAAYFGTNDVTAHQEIPWISELEKFAIFLASEQSIRARDAAIKIAIIDDGVDASLDIFTGKIAAGRSFFPFDGSADLMNAYYVPSGHHGTMIADLICRICPSCQLYVARLDESTNRNDMSRQITVKSAAEAIEWAVACKVDIISMSWTIEGRTEAFQESKDLDSLKTAISTAETNQILMFCAASDQGSNATENCYPSKWGKCIKIGAATALGDKCTWVPSGQFEYLLPGKDIPFKLRVPDGFSTVQESGSSLATALASGLAGLLLCCDRLASADVEAPLRGREKMSDAFRKLAGASRSDKMFVEAHKWFGTKFWRYVREATTANEANGTNSNGVDGKLITKPRPSITKPTVWSNEAGKALLRIMKEIKD
ncbi:hypothetical protein THARTR1_08292 [Trichoderma harzianum]|uniref:Peptidase S8/S53 domain-containing protein n=1 Tax=Trichoderma harzianum TaxID=5544 RepID=A0A2K0TZV5_TRIHA|nr:hypothetical protein THARTR1_08292 [Trichoderma harzianum]